jgi:hypothetical protein
MIAFVKLWRYPCPTDSLNFFTASGGRGGLTKMLVLLPETELINDHSISIYLVFFQIVEQSPPLANQLEKTPSGVMVSLVCFKVLCQISDSFAEKSDLNFRGTCIPFMTLELFNDLFLLFLHERHAVLLLN